MAATAHLSTVAAGAADAGPENYRNPEAYHQWPESGHQLPSPLRGRLTERALMPQYTIKMIQHARMRRVAVSMNPFSPRRW